jgi:hypothetical protein
MRAALLSLLLLSQTAVLVAIFRRSLVRPFLFFSLYILTLLIRQARLSMLDPSTAEYLQFWALTLVILIPLQILAFGEAAYRSLEQFRGLRTGVFIGAMAVAMVVASWIHDLQSRKTHFGVFSQADQAVATTLFLTGLSLSCGLSYINPARRRNALLHERFLLFHFGLIALSLFLLHQGWTWINQFLIPLTALGFLGWVWFVRSEGEQATATIR